MIFPKNPTTGQLLSNEEGHAIYSWNGRGWQKIRQNVTDGDDMWVKNVLTDINKEVPDGAPDGFNFTYTLKYSPLVGSEQVYLNGLLQRRGEGYDYTVIDKYIYFNSPPFEWSSIVCSYSISDKLEIKGEIPTGASDDINAIYTLKYIPLEGTDHVFVNGLLQRYGQNYDYILSDNIIVFNSPPFSGSRVSASYISLK
tara:strand:+ start:2440 stop:3033 length:594 start_codon:yes stop_codon:yes gene_type:complete